MYKLNFNGNHFEIGYTWGRNLLNNNVNLLENIPFEISGRRREFAKNCLPHYEKFYPEILEEIRGISEGQKCKFEDLIAILFSMYSIIPVANCSIFASKTEGNKVIIGRNSDFYVELDKYSMNTIYRFDNKSYNFNGNTTAFVEMEDGINEFGLAVAFTSVKPKKIKAGLNSGMIVRLLLEKCRTVEEAIVLMKEIPISSSQTIIVGDLLGDAVLFECNSEKLTIKKIDCDDRFVFATNMFNTREMIEYNDLPEDNWFARERYETLKDFLSTNRDSMTVEKAKNLLSGDEGFICQYDRASGKDTIWSVIYDLENFKIYRVDGNPRLENFKIDSRDFSNR